MAVDILSLYKFKRLVLLGDIFDDLNFNRLKKEHWNFLSYVRKLSNPRRNVDVIWVEGNHDAGLSKIMAHMMGLKVYRQYEFTVNENKILAIHGHQFDRFLNENVIISNIASYIYDLIQRWGGEKQKLARFIKRQSKGWLRLADKISIRAIHYAKSRNVNSVICGHTHLATEKPFNLNNINYYNTGCLTEIPSSYIIIDDDGKIFNKIEQ